MAEYEHVVVTLTTPSGACQLIAICETSQMVAHPEGGSSPTVVRMRVQNTTNRRATGKWVQSNGVAVTSTVLPGENMETNISPPRRRALHALPTSLSWGG